MNRLFLGREGIEGERERTDYNCNGARSHGREEGGTGQAAGVTGRVATRQKNKPSSHLIFKGRKYKYLRQVATLPILFSPVLLWALNFCGRRKRRRRRRRKRLN